MNRTISYTLAELFLCAVKVSRIYHNPDLDTYQVLIKSSPASSNFSISCSLCLHETLPVQFFMQLVSGRDATLQFFKQLCVWARHYLCSFSCILCLYETLSVQFFMQLVSTQDTTCAVFHAACVYTRQRPLSGKNKQTKKRWKCFKVNSRALR